MRVGQALLLAAVLTVLAAVPAAAQDGAEKPVDVVVLNGNYPPYVILKGDEIDGFGPSLCRKVFARLGIKATLRTLPRKRALDTLRSGEADAVLPIAKVKEREDFLAFPEQPLFIVSSSLFTLKKTNLPYAGKLSDLNGVPISVTEGQPHGFKLDSTDALDFRPSRSDEDMVRMVLMGRYPVGIGNRYVVSYYAYKADMATSIRFLEPEVASSPAFIGFSKKRHREGLAEAFSRELEAFKATADYQQMWHYYMLD